MQLEDPRHLRDRDNRPRAGALAAGADQDDDGVGTQQRLDLRPGFLERLTRDVRVVSRAEMSRRLCADDHSLVGGHVSHRELVGIEEAREHRAADTLGGARIAFLHGREVATEQCLHGAQNVASAATQAQDENRHATAPVLGLGLKWNGITTHAPSARSGWRTNALWLKRCVMRSTSYSTFCR